MKRYCQTKQEAHDIANELATQCGGMFLAKIPVRFKEGWEVCAERRIPSSSLSASTMNWIRVRPQKSGKKFSASANIFSVSHEVPREAVKNLIREVKKGFDTCKLIIDYAYEFSDVK